MVNGVIAVKVAELRETIAKYNEAELHLVIVELYKAIPKKIKEEKEIDKIVTLEVTDRKKKEPKRRELEVIQAEVEVFLNDAYNQYYFAPNSVIHKKDRPKWRFIVRRLYKELLACVHDKPELAGDLLEKLYKLLCYASGYYLFNTNDPFASVMIEQGEFFYSVVQAKLEKGHDGATIEEVIRLAVCNDDSFFFMLSAASTVASSLKTPPLKELALEQVKLLMKQKPPQKEKEDWMEDLTTIGSTLYLSLFEEEAAIAFFNKHYPAKLEAKVYALLLLLEVHQLPELWIREYEAAKAKGVQRQDLERKYERIKKEISS